jgi:hypothetical protein
MTTGTKPLPSPQTPVVDRFLRWTPQWYEFLRPLFDTLRRTEEAAATAAVAITEISEVTDGLNARWGVEIRGTGGTEQVIGLVRLDGNEVSSTFTVVADKFLVSHPTAGVGTIQAFAVGLVDGVSTVGINGNLIVDGTILGRHIAVASLSAISADIGTVTAGLIQAENGKTVINLNTGEWYSTT